MSKLKPSDYPNDWAESSKQAQIRAGHKCEWCGVQGEPNNDNGNLLSTHHLDGDPKNRDPENHIALCSRCHLKAQHFLFRGHILKREDFINRPMQYELFGGKP